jgi:CRP-like cAMP-binding protein
VHNTPRSATITTACASELWALDGDDFRAIQADVSRQRYEEQKTFINSVPIFHLLNEDQKDALSGSLVEHHFSNR